MVEHRGRKGEFSIIQPVATIPGARLAPPTSLAPDEVETWRAIVASMPTGWFDTCPFLVRCLVAHIANAEFLALAVAKMKATKDSPKRTQELNKLSSMLLRETNMIVNLSQKLRLVPRAKYTMERSRNLKEQNTPTSRPWEIRSGGGDDAA